MGNGILQMIQADDVLRVDEDFTMESTMSHATMLTNGRMELGGNFNQSGRTASFGSSNQFMIAFMGSGEHKAHFDNIEYSRFANIDVAHANVVMDDEAIIATGRMLFSIGKGFLSGLQEAWETEGLNATAIAFAAAFGIAMTAAMAIIPAAIVAIISTVAALLSIISASFMAAQAVEGIYSTATGTGTSYQKAEAYAHDAALLLMSIKEIVESGKDILNNLKHLDFIFAGLKGRKTRVDADELGHSVETKTVKTIYSFDDFVDCMQDYLDADSLKYVKQELGKDSDNLSLLNKVAEAIQESSQSIGDAKLNKTDIAFGLDKLHESGSVDDAVQTMVRCSKAKLNRYGNFYDVLEQQGITLDQFDKLKLKNVDTMLEEKPYNIKILQKIRESIPNPTSETCLRKTIPYEEIKEYKRENGWNAIGGYVARDGDVSHIEGYTNVRESLRLDYKDKNGKMPYPPDGNSYGYIKFHMNHTELLEIPYGKMFQGGTNTDKAPCTRNGFLGSTNGEIIPEWRIKNEQRIAPENGAELHQVIDGHDEIVAIYREGHFVEVPTQ